VGRLLDPITQDACAFYEDHVFLKITDESSVVRRIGGLARATMQSDLRGRDELKSSCAQMAQLPFFSTCFSAEILTIITSAGFADASHYLSLIFTTGREPSLGNFLKVCGALRVSPAAMLEIVPPTVRRLSIHRARRRPAQSRRAPHDLIRVSCDQRINASRSASLKEQIGALGGV
jgi:hypothetical protein